MKSKRGRFAIEKCRREWNRRANSHSQCPKVPGWERFVRNEAAEGRRYVEMKDYEAEDGTTQTIEF